MRHDVLSDVLSAVRNGDSAGKKEVTTPVSSMVKNVLLIMQREGFIGEFEFVDEKRGGKFKISLLGNINKCGSVRPRFKVKVDEYEKYERRYLPAAGFGFLIVSTSKGVMTHGNAIKEKVGGKLLAYVY